MAPPANVEFVILKLMYFPHEHPLHPRIYMIRRKPTSCFAHLREWIERVLLYEIAKVSPILDVNYCEWNIISYDPTLFTVNGYQFDGVILIMGEEEVHWMFYYNMSPHTPLEGSGHLSFKYCGCCLGNQYVDIMESVRDYVNKKSDA